MAAVRSVGAFGGAAAVEGVSVQLWMSVCTPRPPVPPVNPMKPWAAPSTPGMSTG